MQKSIKTALLVLMVCCLCVIALYPYWFLGEHSAVGWYDEFDVSLPYLTLKATSALNHTFLHDFAGGTPDDTGIFYANEFGSIPILFLNLFSPVVGAFLFRFFGLFLTFVSLYILGAWLAKTQQDTPTLSKPLFYAAIFTGCFGCFSVYVGIWGAFGLIFPLLIMVPLILLGCEQKVLKFVLLAVSAYLASAGGFPPSFFVFAVVVSTLAITIASGRLRISFFTQNFVYVFFFATFYLVLSIPNLVTVLTVWEESARISKINSFATLNGDFGVVENWYERIYLSFKNLCQTGRLLLDSGPKLGSAEVWDTRGFPPTGWIFFVLSLTTLIGVWWTRNANYLIAIFLILIAPFVFQLGSTLTGFLSTFRWDNLWLFLFPLTPIFAVQALCSSHSSSKINYLKLSAIRGSVTLVLLGLSTIGIMNLIMRPINDMNYHGGWQGITNIPIMKQLSNTYPNAVSFSTIGYEPKAVMAPLHGVTAIDGVLQNFSWRRTAFWFTSLVSVPVEPWHTHRQTGSRSFTELHTPSLKLIGVTHLLAQNPMDHLPNNTVLWSKQDPVIIHHKSLFGFGPSQSTLSTPALYVYAWEGAWERAFVPKSIKQTVFSERSKDFYLHLRNLPRHTVILPTQNRIETGALSQINWEIELPSKDFIKKTPHGYQIKTNGKAGPLVLNQVFQNQWRAKACGENLDISPVNAMHMLVFAPEGCQKVDFLVKPAFAL